jgi:glycosyltransferase involved in cell wall biosynthesis
MVRIVAPLARLATARGYRISALFLGDGPLRQELEEAGVPAAVIPWSGRKTDLVAMWRLVMWLRAHPADIAHLHHGGQRMRELCRWAGARVVIQHVHGEVVEPELSSIAKVGFEGTDAVIACSRAVAAKLSHCKPETIYAGIETGHEVPNPPSATGPLRLGMLSRLVPLKRIEALIEATARLTEMGIDVETEIGGDGPSEASLRALTERLGIGSRVRFLGWQQNAAALLASWHVLVLPSITEGFGIAVLEAMAAARPVVASRVGGLEELVDDGVTGRLIAPGDAVALAECLAELAGDREQLARLGRNAFYRVQTEFSASATAHKMTSLYDRLLAGRLARR